MTSISTTVNKHDPNYMPPIGQAIPLGLQHVLEMFASNVTPAIIVAGAAGFGFGSDQGALGFPDMRYMIQMSMLFAGIATLFQTIGMGPVGARASVRFKASRSLLCIRGLMEISQSDISAASIFR